MMATPAPIPGRLVYGASLVAGPLLFAASSFFWTPDGEYGVTGGALLVFGSLFWILSFVGLFGDLHANAPRYAAIGLPVAVYGAICGGAAFAFQGMFTTLYGVSHEQALAALDRHPVIANAIFWIGGPAFPLSLVGLGLMLARTRLVPWWAGGMLAAGGALFPLARIPRIELIAHGVDLLMLVPSAYLGWRVLRERPS